MLIVQFLKNYHCVNNSIKSDILKSKLLDLSSSFYYKGFLYPVLVCNLISLVYNFNLMIIGIIIQ